MSADDAITLLFTGAPASADKFTPGMATAALVRLNGRTLIFDPGPYAYRPILLGRLKALGLTPSDIDTVVLSHVHWDAASNADLFPKAEVILHEREWAYAEDQTQHDAQTAGYIGRILHKLNLKTVANDTDLGSGLRLIDLPGHTPGTLGLIVNNALLAGDAVVCARDAATGVASMGPQDQARADDSLVRALNSADVIYPGHDRPFRIDAGRLTHVSDYTLRIRLFLDPRGPDEEVQISSSAPKSFASWP